MGLPRKDFIVSTEDRLDILQVIAEYSYTFDSKDAEGWSKLFTDDAVWEFIGAQSDAPLMKLDGREQILAWAKQRHGEIPDNIRSYHHQSGIAFEAVTPESARTRVMVIITAHDFTETEPKIRVTLTGVYHDEWRKTPKGWRFAHRALKV